MNKKLDSDELASASLGASAAVGDLVPLLDISDSNEPKTSTLTQIGKVILTGGAALGAAPATDDVIAFSDTSASGVIKTMTVANLARGVGFDANGFPTAIPTTLPGTAGRVWNDNGVLKAVLV